MPTNVFRLVVVGQLFMILAYQQGTSIMTEVSAFLLGSGFIICGFVAWIEERREKEAERKQREAGRGLGSPE